LKPIVFVIAKQRSGTNYLRSMLVSTGRIADCGEVVHPDGSMEEHENSNYLRFRRKVLEKKPELSIPTRENVQELFTRYLDFLAQHAPEEEWRLVDVKYNAVHNFNTVWYSPLERPHLFTLLDQWEIPVIHLVRENIFRCYVSSVFASANNFYLLKDEDRPVLKQVQIVPGEMIAALRQRKREIDWFRKHLRYCKRMVEVRYEEFSESISAFVREAKPKIERLLEMKLSDSFQSPYQRIIEEPGQVIENYQEVITVLKNSEFAAYASS
jgi:hypothetical protein